MASSKRRASLAANAAYERLFSLLLLLAGCARVLPLTVDNQLVSARNDCFERIALEAMLPFEKAFRTEDTNSLKTCKEKCIQAGEKCQSIAFGVHRRGNGTCQLSEEKFEPSAGRPRGIIFDPDFDLYGRKTSCFDLSDNTIPLSDTTVDGGGGSTGYGGQSPTTPTYLSPSSGGSTRPHDVGGTPILVVSPTPSTTTTLYERPATPPLGSTTLGGGGGGGYGGGPTTTIHYVPSTLGPHTPVTPTDGDRLYFSHDIYPPLYKYPTLYEHNYPAPNQDDVYIPGGYASNVPEVYDSYRPGGYGGSGGGGQDEVRPTPHGAPRPVFGLGYGNGYSYGQPEKYYPSTPRPAYDQTMGGGGSGSGYATRPYDRPPAYPSDQRPPLGPSGGRPQYDQRPTTPPSNYYPRPDYGRPPNAQDQRPPPGPLPPSRPAPPYAGRPPSDYPPDYTNRPDPPLPGGGGGGTSARPPLRDPPPTYGGGGSDFARRNGTAARPDGGGYNDDKTIATYFNPDDYMGGGGTKRPEGYDDRRPASYPMRACFRRVLAGKRIAPHWVRRTIACERVEECMRECGQEKRFTCEGFNYRLDPSGHGQGDCELIEVPLAKMDLYSSPHQRDSNLLRHPDYDYYERDRNAPSSCRRNAGCLDCSSPPLYVKPSGGGGGSGSGSGWSDRPYREEHYAPPTATHSGSGGGGGSYYSDSHRYHAHSGGGSSTALDRYRPPSGPPPPISYDHRPPPPDYHSSSYEFSSHSGGGGSSYYEHTPPSSSGPGGPIDRYDYVRPDDHYHPQRPAGHWETLPSSSGYDGDSRYRPRPPNVDGDRYRPPYRPGPEYSPYRPTAPHDSGPPPSGPTSTYHPGPPRPPPAPPTHNYLDRDGPGSSYKKSSQKYVPYLIGGEQDNYGNYGGSYGGDSNNKQSSYWGLSDDYQRRKDRLDFNYFELGADGGGGGGSRRPPPRESNSVLSYPGSSYSGGGGGGFHDRHDYRQQWTRRPGPDECSAKTSEGFRLHKTAVRHTYTAPTLTECERLCSGHNDFECQTYSYRYAQAGRDNCMLCDRPVNLLDYYVDIEPDRDYDIYSMADDMDACRKPSRSDGPPPHSGSTALSDPRNAQCFFRAIDATRFFKSIVRDSLTVRSVGECEMECIKSNKFTCRAFAYRYGQQRHASVIDNCQLSDWPVRDMDKERHLVRDTAFDVFERASYGHGCEIQPIMDEKHKKFCYLGYGSPAKLLSAAVKKVISVPSERDCKKECVRYRDTTPFKCYSFSFGSRATSYNCELSDLDQTELKLNVHYTHTNDRDYWLFAWNPFDWTCRDKVNTIGGSRVNNDRRMDIFREPGDLVAWPHYSVAGKPCRRNSPCAKNLVTGFYSCELESGEVGSWDYCCKADHPCGYSQGFAYPWCFVGDEPDQWRKCSDRYFPPGNHTTTTKLTHSGIALAASQHAPKDTKKKPPTDGGSSSGDYQRPPRPGGLQSLSDFAAARLWPVTYLYSEGPPNSTEFSNFVDCNKESC